MLTNLHHKWDSGTAARGSEWLLGALERTVQGRDYPDGSGVVRLYNIGWRYCLSDSFDRSGMLGRLLRFILRCMPDWLVLMTDLGVIELARRPTAVMRRFM